MRGGWRCSRVPHTGIKELVISARVSMPKYSARPRINGNTRTIFKLDRIVPLRFHSRARAPILCLLSSIRGQ